MSEELDLLRIVYEDKWWVDEEYDCCDGCGVEEHWDGRPGNFRVWFEHLPDCPVLRIRALLEESRV